MAWELTGNIRGPSAGVGGDFGFTAPVGDGLTSEIDIVHGLGSRSVHVSLFETAAPFADVSVPITRVDVNTVRLHFIDPPETGELTVVVSGGTADTVTMPGPTGPVGPEGPQGPAGESPPLGQLLTWVEHGADANVARPAGYGMVFWTGTVHPLNATGIDVVIRTDQAIP